MKILSRGLLGLVLFSILSSHAIAEIPAADFEKAMGAYLKTEKGQAAIGDAVQNFFKKQQDQARADKAKQQAKALEEQFKNPLKVEIGNSPSKGPQDAKITIVEFSDFECPFCTRGNNTMTQVMEAYPKDVRVVFKNLPLHFHKNADPAARAALAAGKQGKFWEMHDVLFANQRKLNQALYDKTAKELGLDMDKFKADMESDEVKAQVKADMAEARKLRITGTPGFTVNGVLVKGAYPFEHFKMIIDRWLEEK